MVISLDKIYTYKCTKCISRVVDLVGYYYYWS